MGHPPSTIPQPDFHPARVTLEAEFEAVALLVDESERLGEILRAIL